MYDTVEDASQKLQNTVIFYQGRPVHVRYISGPNDNIGLRLSYLPYTHNPQTEEAPEFQVVLSDKDLDWLSPSSCLGYINYLTSTGKFKTIYSYRRPYRISVQGLSQRNVTLEVNGYERGWTPSWESLLSSNKYYGRNFLGLATPLIKDYPSMDLAAKDIDEFGKKGDPDISMSCAFHRKFALRRPTVGPMYLMYKGQDIAYTDDVHKFFLGRRYEFLRETLEHNGLKVV